MQPITYTKGCEETKETYFTFHVHLSIYISFDKCKNIIYVLYISVFVYTI